MSVSSLSRVALVLTLIAVPSRAAETPAFTRVLPERVVGDPSQENGKVHQVLQADSKGRVFLLHGDNLEIDQLQPSGKLTVYRRPQEHAAGNSAVWDAAMRPDGGAWLLGSSDHLSLLDGDDLRELPASDWLVSALAYTDYGPVIAVLPAWVANRAIDNKIAANPPFVLELRDQTWRPLVSQESLHARGGERPESIFVTFKAERDTALAAGRKGVLWVAQQNAYSLRRYTSTGVLAESIAVGGAPVEWKDRKEEDWKRLEKLARDGGMTSFDRSSLPKAAASPVIRGLTAQDSRVYLVVETAQGLALDRWDSDTQTLERVLLEGIAPHRQGHINVAAGRDGLYIATVGLGEPIWRLEWQRLEQLKWGTVPGGKAETAPATSRQ